MKQAEIKTGETYLFGYTIDETKKDMVGKTFKVMKTIKGQKNKYVYKNRRGKRPNKYLLDNGRYAKACELKKCKN